MGAGVMRMFFDEQAGSPHKRSQIQRQLPIARLDDMCVTYEQNAFMGLFPELLQQTIQYLSPQEAHSVLVGPICRSFYKQVTCNKLLWRAMCASDPWYIKYDNLDNICHCSIKARLHGAGKFSGSNSTMCGNQQRPSFMRFSAFKRVPSLLSLSSAYRSSDREDDTFWGQDVNSKSSWKATPRSISADSFSIGKHSHSLHQLSDEKEDDSKENLSRATATSCGKAYCIAWALRKQHSILVQQVRHIRDESQPQLARVELICEAMHRYPVVAGIQVECLEAINPLLEHEEVRKRAQESALGHAVVGCLRNFSFRIDLQHVALHCLVLLARPIGGREGAVHIGMAPALPALSGPRGGISSVMDIMDEHTNESKLQAMACWTLVNFALNADCKAQLLSMGGLLRILRAMETHPNNYAVQFRGLFALINLVVPDVPNQQPEEITQVIKRVQSAMETFSKDTRLMNRGCLVLQNLSLNDMNHWALCTSRTKDVLLRALQEHGSDDSMLKLSAQATTSRIFGPSTSSSSILPANLSSRTPTSIAHSLGPHLATPSTVLEESRRSRLTHASMLMMPGNPTSIFESSDVQAAQRAQQQQPLVGQHATIEGTMALRTSFGIIDLPPSTRNA